MFFLVIGACVVQWTLGGQFFLVVGNLKENRKFISLFFFLFSFTVDSFYRPIKGFCLFQTSSLHIFILWEAAVCS